MPKRRIVDIRDQVPLLDIASYGRRRPGHRSLSKAELAHISRTVRRVPEVLVKVSGGARTLRGVAQHLDYIGREGRGEVQADDGERLQRKGFEKALLQDWDLDLEAYRRHTERGISAGRKPPKLVHNIVFSMPKGTPPEKVLRAVQIFAREKFAVKHRYLMALHVDRGHPHVHMVVKAVSEQGKRLNVGKSTLREWRSQFARHLREQGIEANATERAVRGETRMQKPDGIYRATLRGESTYTRARAESVASEVLTGKLRFEAGKPKLLETRREIESGWRAIRDVLLAQDQPELAAEVHRFLNRMRPPRTERESIAAALEGQRRQVLRSFQPRVR